MVGIIDLVFKMFNSKKTETSKSSISFTGVGPPAISPAPYDPTSGGSILPTTFSEDHFYLVIFRNQPKKLRKVKKFDDSCLLAGGLRTCQLHD